MILGLPSFYPTFVHKKIIRVFNSLVLNSETRFLTPPPPPINWTVKNRNELLLDNAIINRLRFTLET